MNVVRAIEVLDGPLSDVRVHEARRALKRARAELRLVRARIGQPQYALANRTLRDAGRALSPWRDSRILVDACDPVARKLGGGAPRRVLRSLRGRLVRQHRKFTGSPGRAQQATRRARRQLDLLLERSRHWPSAALDAQLLSAGATRIYREGRKSYALARDQRSASALHEWRKQSQYLGEALASLGGGRGRRIDKLAKQMSRIAKTLGTHHDLYLLRQKVKSTARIDADPDTIKVVVDAIDRRRKKLERRALDAGRRLYEDRPRVFATGLGKSLLKRH